MKHNEKLIYLIEAILFISVIIFNILNIKYSYNIIVIILAGFAYIKLGFIKDNAYEKGNVIRIVLAALLSYMLITNFLGIFTGFAKNIFKFNFDTIIFGIILNVITIVSIEVLRYIVAKNCYRSKLPIILFTFIMIILNIVMQIKMNYLSDRWLLFVFISTFVVPLIAQELLYSYIAYKNSLVPNIIYRIAMELYVYVIPIIPNLGNYIYSVLKVFLPFIIYYFANKSILKNSKDKKYSKRVSRRLIYTPIIIFLVICVTLITGIFGWKMIAIGSGSMEPEFYMGDAVIYKTVNKNELKIGDIIAFNSGRRVITHRIYSIKKDSFGNMTITTKGDNNKAVDQDTVSSDDVLGVVKYVFKFIGYPTLWLNEILE